MKKEVYKVVGLIYGIIGIGVFLLNFIGSFLITQETKQFNMFQLIYIIFGIILILLSVTRKDYLSFTIRNKRVEISIKMLNCLIQFYILVFLCVFGILEDHSGQYNLSMLMIAGLMGLKYHILGKKSLIIMIVFFSVLFQVSAWLSGLYLRGLYILLFSTFFFGITIIMYQEDLKRHFDLVKKYHDKLVSLEHIIDKFKNETLDISTINFTPRELEVLKEFCLSRATNQELANNMGLKVQTIKTHLRNIFDKSGVDDRYQLIDLFKHNFEK